MIVLGIDPGPDKCGVVFLDYIDKKYTLYASGEVSIKDIEFFISGCSIEYCNSLTFAPDVNLSCTVGISHVAIESITCQGKVVGKSVFDTAENIGRITMLADLSKINICKIPRTTVKIHLCGGTSYIDPNGSRRAVTDTTVKKALIERFQQTGGGKEPSIGTKNNRGPLYIMKGHTHAWSALAIAVTCCEIQLTD